MSKTPRDRLIDTAGELFYERGLPNVGINEVTERAGVARMTLYNHFESKEALALAAFERQAEERQALVDKYIKRARTPSQSIRAVFDVAEMLAARTDFRGCAFLNVAIQEPHSKGKIFALVRAHKNSLRSKFRDIAARAGCAKPETIAQQLLALWDGAIVEAFIQGNAEPIRASKTAAAILLRAGERSQ